MASLSAVSFNKEGTKKETNNIFRAEIKPERKLVSARIIITTTKSGTGLFLEYLH